VTAGLDPTTWECKFLMTFQDSPTYGFTLTLDQARDLGRDLLELVADFEIRVALIPLDRRLRQLEEVLSSQSDTDTTSPSVTD